MLRDYFRLLGLLRVMVLRLPSLGHTGDMGNLGNKILLTAIKCANVPPFNFVFYPERSYLP